jgi:hypothetical protein
MVETTAGTGEYYANIGLSSSEDAIHHLGGPRADPAAELGRLGGVVS